MRTGFRVPFSAAVVIAVGLIVLAGYFLPLDFLNLSVLKEAFLRWASILFAVALLVGLANLFSVHWQRVSEGSPASIYSLVTLVAMAGTVAVAGYFGPTGQWSLFIYNNIQVPIEASLMALLAVILAYASARLLGRRLSLFSAVFIAVALVVLLGMASIPGIDFPWFSDARSWLARVPAAAGARGLLLGVALGSVATGLRILMGADRPYQG